MEEKGKKEEVIYITEEDLAAPPTPMTPPVPGMPPMPGVPGPGVIEVRLCPSCLRQIQLTPKLVYCPYCSYQLQPEPTFEPLKESMAALFAILPGLLGFFGIGHFYARRLGVGFVFLLAGLALAAAAGWCFWLLNELVWGAVFVLAYLGVLVWQTFDAVASVREHNRVLEAP